MVCKSNIYAWVEMGFRHRSAADLEQQQPPFQGLAQFLGRGAASAERCGEAIHQHGRVRAPALPHVVVQPPGELQRAMHM